LRVRQPLGKLQDHCLNRIENMTLANLIKFY
jgi:hypothetical protein